MGLRCPRCAGPVLTGRSRRRSPRSKRGESASPRWGCRSRRGRRPGRYSRRRRRGRSRGVRRSRSRPHTCSRSSGR
nr:MAG TPA: hypothetical protein [Caudoviricetes sp.]